MAPDFRKANIPLSKDVLSLYPAFYDDNVLYMVDEAVNQHFPNIVEYEISSFLNAE